MRKLNCLIAVLEVATAKVRKNMAGSPPDSERLARICANLESTLEVCQRARTALERRNGASAQSVRPQSARPESADPVVVPRPPARAQRSPSKPNPDAKKRRRRLLTDISTEAERRKFEKLPPIDRRSIRSCDFDELARKLCS
jgi:hypothetical protein